MSTLIKLSWVELKLFVREPITVIFTLVLPVIMLFVMAGVFGNEVTTDPESGTAIFRGVGPLDYYMPAYFGLVLMAIGTMALPVHLASYRERGVLRRLRASSISVWSVLGSQMVVSFVIAMLGSLLVFIMGIIAYSPHMPQEVGLVVLAFLLGLVCFTALGFFLGAVLPSTRAAQGLGLIRDTIFDTHFVQRSRISRLVHAVATNPALLGLGIEENTGLLIEDETRAKVIGTGTVIVLDGSAIEINHIGYVENRMPFALSNVVYSLLTPGMMYDLKKRTVIDPGPIAPPRSMVPKKKKSPQTDPVAVANASLSIRANAGTKTSFEINSSISISLVSSRYSDSSFTSHKL